MTNLIIRIEPNFYLYTPLGVAEAHFLSLPDGNETAPQWGCFQCETKENWWWPSQLVRMCESVSAIRSSSHSQIVLKDDYFETLKPHILRHKESPFYGRANGEGLSARTDLIAGLYEADVRTFASR